METVIDYSTLNMAITTIINGRSVIIHTPPPSKEVLKRASRVLGLYYAMMVENIGQSMIFRDWEIFIDDAISISANNRFPKNEETDPKVQTYIQEIKSNINEMLNFALSLSYIIDGSNVAKFNEAEFSLVENITETIKGTILFFIATVRYISGTASSTDMQSDNCVYTSQDATTYATTLLTQPKNSEILDK